MHESLVVHWILSFRHVLPLYEQFAEILSSNHQAYLENGSVSIVKSKVNYPYGTAHDGRGMFFSPAANAQSLVNLSESPWMFRATRAKLGWTVSRLFQYVNEWTFSWGSERLAVEKVGAGSTEGYGVWTILVGMDDRRPVLQYLISAAQEALDGVYKPRWLWQSLSIVATGSIIVTLKAPTLLAIVTFILDGNTQKSPQKHQQQPLMTSRKKLVPRLLPVRQRPLEKVEREAKVRPKPWRKARKLLPPNLGHMPTKCVKWAQRLPWPNGNSWERLTEAMDRLWVSQQQIRTTGLSSLKRPRRQ